jgi:hypothetical protein
MKLGTVPTIGRSRCSMEINHPTFIYSVNSGEGISQNDFEVEFFDYNPELCCDGTPIKVIKNFDELLTFLDECED